MTLPARSPPCPAIPRKSPDSRGAGARLPAFCALNPLMAFTKTYDGAEPQRVNKWLAQAGVCSRREAEALIAQGLVFIDGARVTDAGRKIETGQTLTLQEAASAQLGAQLTAVIHKPVGVVSAHPEPGQIEAARLLTAANLVGPGEAPAPGASLPPLGRLDRDSRGLLLLSEDGVLAKAVIGPDSPLDKEYLVRVAGEITDRKLRYLRHGLDLDGRELKPAHVEEIGQQRLRFILTEGRNRQIRRMCELVDLGVTDLLRIRIGPLSLGDLPEGKWRALSSQERAALLQG
jgi:23S rRNA pseudouridine2604 synthase